MEEKKDNVLYVPVEDILPNRFQPRLAFDEKELNELANSIIKYGVIQPIVLRKIGEKYEIIAGERRYKASCLAGLKKIPAIIKNTDDNTSAEIALLENIQRKNLTVIEEAQSYKKLIDKGFTQDDIATKLGVSQSSVANKMRLLNLPKEVQDALLFNRISERHARSLLSLNDADLQKNLLGRIINERLTVKQTEDEIGMLLNRNNEVEELPADIQRFLKAEPTQINKETLLGEKQVEEVLDIKVPEVVNIKVEEAKPEIVEYNEDTEVINPFQVGSNTIVSQPTPVTFETNETQNLYEFNEITPSIEKNNVIPSEKPFNPFKGYEIEEEVVEDVVSEDTLINEYGEVDLPKVINKVRDFITGLGEVSNLITTSELDLTDKYQIVIEIDKK